MRLILSIFLLVNLVFIPVAPAGAAAPHVTTASAATLPTPAPVTQFARFVQNADGSARLELADVTYRNVDDVVVHLVGAVHIADEAFYASLNESFRQYDALLYEMVKPAGMAMNKPQKGRPSHHWVGSLQQLMTRKLGLSYQPDVIDYTAGNFVHADMDWETFEARQTKRGESLFGLMLQATLQEMSGNSAGEAASTFGIMDLLHALQSSDSARDLKALLGPEMAKAESLLDRIDSQNGTVLISERNAVAIEVLKQRIAAGDKLVGIFYGEAHLKKLEQALVNDMAFRRVDTVWRTAWDIPKAVKSTTQRSPASQPAPAMP